MFEHNFVHQRISFSHPLWEDLPPGSLTAEGVKGLVQLQEWECLILRFGHRGLLIAGFYIQMGGNIEEMVSAAMLGICMAVDEMKKDDFKNENPRGYIISFIHQCCFETLQADTTIPVPRYMKKTHGAKQIYTCPLIDASDGTEDFDIIEFDEIMEKIVDSELEREVCALRRIGNTDAEVAELLGDVSRSTITRVRKTLYERYVNYV